MDTVLNIYIGFNWKITLWTIFFGWDCCQYRSILHMWVLKFAQQQLLSFLCPWGQQVWQPVPPTEGEQRALFPLEILAVSLNALPEAWQIAVNCSLVFFWVNHEDDVVQGSLQFICITETDPSETRLHSVKEPVVRWTQIWAVSGVGHKFNVLVC